MIMYDQKMRENIEKLVPTLAEFITSKANEFFEDEAQKLNFILSTAVNLCGNLVMHHGDDELNMKDLAAQTISNLTEWYKFAFSTRKIREESH